MEELNAQKEVLVSLADCCTVLQGKNVDKKKTNEEAQGLPVIVGASDWCAGHCHPNAGAASRSAIRSIPKKATFWYR